MAESYNYLKILVPIRFLCSYSNCTNI